METLLEMEENLLALSTDILKIEMQLGEAKYNAKAKGEYSDGEWYKKANYALGIKKIQKRQLDTDLIIARRNEKKKQSELNMAERKINSEIKRNEKETRMKHLGIIFMDIARENLTDKKFQQILDKALLKLELGGKQ